MRFLANENFPGAGVAALARAGHDIVWIRNAAPGISDAEVLTWAVRERRVLLTFDKDFGDLARRARLGAGCGIILFRIPMPSPSQVGERVREIIEARTDWVGNFAVIEPARVRMRALAGARR